MKILSKLMPKTLLGQIISGFTLVILCYSLMLISLHSYFKANFFMNLQIEKGEQHAAVLAKLSSTGLYTENQVHLQETMEAILSREEVLAVALYRHDGNIFLKKEKEKHSFRQLPAATVQALLGSGGAAFRLEPHTSKEIYQFFVPVTIKRFMDPGGEFDSSGQEQIIGLAEVQLSPEYKNALILRGHLMDASSAAVAIIFSIIIAILLSRRLSAPVQALTEGAKRAAEDELPAPVHVNATGELGDLADAFNHMLASRKETENRLHRELLLNEALAQLSRELISSSDHLEKIASLVLEKAQDLTGSAHGYVSSINQKNGDNICHAFTEIINGQCAVSAEKKHIIFHPDKNGKYAELWGYSLNEEKPFYTNDPANHPEFIGIPEGHPALEQFLSLPVLFDNVAVGQISLANPGRPYTNNDIAIIERVADLYALAINRSRSLQEREKLLIDLRQSQKMEAIGTLAGGIAHDFNNILSAIFGFTGISLLQCEKDSKMYYNLTMVQKAAFRARDLVAQILTFSRQKKSEPFPIQIVPTVKEAIKLLRASLPSSIELQQQISSESGKIIADPVQIHQIVMNICTNASHAMPKKGGTIQIVLENVTVEEKAAMQSKDFHIGPYLLLSISDNGAGMTKEILERIFEPFYTTKEKGRGTGMGLSTVHGIMQEYGGVITVESTPSEGTIFNLFFPRIEGNEQQEAAVSSVISAPMGSGNILFVDDEAELAQLGKNMLELLGYTVDIFTSSPSALEKFRAAPNSYDLIITDQTMPKMSGMELSSEILSIRPDIPVFLCTGYSSFVSDKEARNCGIRKFFMKPLHVQQLARAMKDAIGSKASL